MKCVLGTEQLQGPCGKVARGGHIWKIGRAKTLFKNKTAPSQVLTALALCVDRVYFPNIIQERVRAAHLVLISPAVKRESCDQRASKRLTGLAEHPENKGSQVFIECLLSASPCMGYFPGIYLFQAVVTRGRWLPSRLPLEKLKSGAP